jgi:hypothetical protein
MCMDLKLQYQIVSIAHESHWKQGVCRLTPSHVMLSGIVEWVGSPVPHLRYTERNNRP